MGRQSRKSNPSNGLTGIPQGIHCPATTARGGINDELEQLQVNHFLATLARIALAVAARRASTDGGGLA